MKEILWDEKTVTKVTGGNSNFSWEATGVSFDSRSIKEGDLFVAITDERDGHQFVRDAFKKGAAAAMVSYIPKDVDEKSPLLLVDDVMKSLVSLATLARKRSKATIVGITGTAGKTSTKNITNSLLNIYGKTHSSIKSFNNALGCSITLATIPKDAQYVVVEIGTNNLGEISELSGLVRPDYVIITEVSIGHLEGLKSLKNILKEKASICKGQKKNRFALIPSDITLYDSLRKEIIGFGSKPVSFGKKISSDYRILSSQVSSSGTKTNILLSNGEKASFVIDAVGEHHARNATSTIALLALMDLDINKALPILANWQPMEGRGEIICINFYKLGRRKRFYLIDESYNANPASVNSALDTLINFSPLEDRKKRNKIRSCRRIAVLGDMLELGRNELKEHKRIKDLEVFGKVDIVHCVGMRMSSLFNILPEKKRGFWTKTANEMCAKMVKKIDNGDVITVKGSLSMDMKQIILGLKKLQKVSS